MAAEVSESPQVIPMTWEDFCALGEDVRGEYLDGHLVVSPLGTFEHQSASFNVATLLRRAGLVSVTEWAWRPPAARREYQPDVMVLDERPADPRANWTEATPALLVEVTSPSNASKDWLRNVRDYARFGARHYWILDHRDHTLYAFELQEGQFEETAQSAGRVVVPGWEHVGEIDVVSLWR